ncbi:MAG TPA: NAD-binding protein, partial [Methanocorpusculum sp.]|nr:NAD-binding protein [Methanocorpusculum sp.]
LNPDTVVREKKRGENIIYGDACHESILEYAGIRKAQTIVISISIMDSIKGIITTARRMNPKISIITRSRYISETSELYRLGADEVIVDEKEAALQIFRRILANQQIPVQELEMYSQQVRSEVYNEYLDGTGGGRPPVPERKNGGGVLDAIRLRAKHADEVISTSKTYVEQIRVGKDCDCAGKRLCDLHLRMNFGVSVISVRRAGHKDAIVSPDGDTVLEEGDTVVVIGNRDSIASMMVLFIERTE